MNYNRLNRQEIPVLTKIYTIHPHFQRVCEGLISFITKEKETIPINSHYRGHKILLFWTVIYQKYTELLCTLHITENDLIIKLFQITDEYSNGSNPKNEIKVAVAKSNPIWNDMRSLIFWTFFFSEDGIRDLLYQNRNAERKFRK